MTDTELIADQCRRIRVLEKARDGAHHELMRIHNVLFNIGGPLNDNILMFTNKQLVPFAMIDKAKSDAIDILEEAK